MSRVIKGHRGRQRRIERNIRGESKVESHGGRHGGVSLALRAEKSRQREKEGERGKDRLMLKQQGWRNEELAVQIRGSDERWKGMIKDWRIERDDGRGSILNVKRRA